MSDLISREAALKAAKMVYIECLYMDEKDYEECVADDLCVVFASDIKKIPAVDAVPVVHGRWIPVDGEFECDEYDCSACGNRRTFLEEMSCEDMAEHYPYCPNCGAKMDGGKDNG